MKVSEYLNAWLSDRELYCQRSTWEALTVYVTKHLAPYFAQDELSELVPMKCQQYARDKLRKL